MSSNSNWQNMVGFLKGFKLTPSISMIAPSHRSIVPIASHEENVHAAQVYVPPPQNPPEPVDLPLPTSGGQPKNCEVAEPSADIPASATSLISSAAHICSNTVSILLANTCLMNNSDENHIPMYSTGLGMVRSLCSKETTVSYVAMASYGRQGL